MSAHARPDVNAILQITNLDGAVLVTREKEPPRARPDPQRKVVFVDARTANVGAIGGRHGAHPAACDPCSQSPVSSPFACPQRRGCCRQAYRFPVAASRTTTRDGSHDTVCKNICGWSRSPYGPVTSASPILERRIGLACPPPSDIGTENRARAPTRAAPILNPYSAPSLAFCVPMRESRSARTRKDASGMDPGWVEMRPRKR